ncbi:haloalkane dehalogenase [Ideonella sp. A 288]|uniref:haloalkane dehalogenase n=1 Tax=Ideonella sp. A 288 TaxID=1962181 RepID=UPI000B4B8B7B|nr:haloalkane dehalogenase [Ideonella sp. A 288]
MLRTPDERFAALPGYGFAPHYLDDLVGADGARMHYLDEGPRDAAATVLALHGNPSWSYLYRHMIPVFTAAGLRVVAPDLIGFGRSDKPADESWHSFERHRGLLRAFVERLDLHDVMLVCQDWGGIFGLTLPMAMPERFSRLLVMNTTLATGSVTEGFRQWRAYSNGLPDLPVGKLLARGKPDMTAAEAAGYDAPFPDVTYKAALRAFPNLVPDGADAPGAAIGREAVEFWRDRWTGQSVMAVGLKDPVLGGEPMRALQRGIRGCPAPIEVAEGGHFLPEWGGPIASAALSAFGLSR